MCAGQTAQKYTPFLWVWVAVTAIVATVFVVQTVRELKGFSAKR